MQHFVYIQVARGVMQFSETILVICACLSTSGSMACSSNFLESFWQCRRIFYKPTFSKTWTPTRAMGWQLSEIWWNAISTKNMVHSCSTSCLMFFWKRVRPVLSWNVCIVNLWFWFVQFFSFAFPPVSWKDRSHWLARAKERCTMAPQWTTHLATSVQSDTGTEKSTTRQRKKTVEHAADGAFVGRVTCFDFDLQICRGNNTAHWIWKWQGRFFVMFLVFVPGNPGKSSAGNWYIPD